MAVAPFIGLVLECDPRVAVSSMCAGFFKPDQQLVKTLKVAFPCSFQMQLYSEPDFQGRLVILEDGAAALDEDFTPRSCKVLVGR